MSTSKSLSFVYLCVVLKSALSLRNGDTTYTMRPHNKPTVFIHVEYQEDIILASGVLLNREYVLTSGLSIPQNATNVVIRAASLKSYEGGIVRDVTDDRMYMGLADPDERLQFCLARLSLPLDLPPDYFAFLITYQYRPAAYDSDHSERFVITGWNTRRAFAMLQEEPDMNVMMLKESNMFACSQDYEYLEKFMYDQEDVLGCFCPITCEFVCSTSQFPVWIDNGAGLFVKHTNLLLGVVQSRLNRKNLHVNALISRADRIVFPHVMRLLDEYEDFEEFDGRL